MDAPNATAVRIWEALARCDRMFFNAQRRLRRPVAEVRRHLTLVPLTDGRRVELGVETVVDPDGRAAYWQLGVEGGCRSGPSPLGSAEPVREGSSACVHSFGLGIDTARGADSACGLDRENVLERPRLSYCAPDPPRLVSSTGPRLSSSRTATPRPIFTP